MVDRSRDLVLVGPDGSILEKPRGRPSSLSIVIPALNEENGIDAILQRVLAQREGLAVGINELEVIVVDDGSKDKTRRPHPCLRRRSPDPASSESGVRRGPQDRLQRRHRRPAGVPGRRRHLPAGVVPGSRQAVEEHNADLIIGSRMLSGESEMPLVRRIGNTIFAGAAQHRRLAEDLGQRQWHAGLPPRSLPILYPLPDGLDFTPAMSTRAVYEGLDMVEVPIPYKERVGRSKLNPLKDGIRFLRSILWTALLYDPQRFFGTFGTGAAGAGGWCSGSAPLSTTSRIAICKRT